MTGSRLQEVGPASARDALGTSPRARGMSRTLEADTGAAALLGSRARVTTPPGVVRQHLAYLQRTGGNAAVSTLLQRSGRAERRTFPWLGRIADTPSAALRKSPDKDAADPTRNTVQDLPRGTEIRVIGAKGGWLHVEVPGRDGISTGYVSQELVTFVSASAFDVGAIEVTVDLPTVDEAFVELKRAEVRTRTNQKLTADEIDRLELAASVLEATGKYIVDQATWMVDFKRAPGVRTQVLTIEDFILFVEDVERAYPSASRVEIASEIRQMWHEDTNWSVLTTGSGIRSNGKPVNMETEGPIAAAFDMKQIAPNKKGSPLKGLKVKTAMGTVDMSHVMAGIDVAVSGGMASGYPGGFLDFFGYDKAGVAFEFLKKASGGDTRDIATWSGDLGQVYAEFLIDRYVRANARATLAAWTAQKMTKEELRGDIHGFVAQTVFTTVPTNLSPTGEDTRISSILRDTYLVPKKASATLGEHFATAAGKKPAELRDYIVKRTLAFSRIWFAAGTFLEGMQALTPEPTPEVHGGLPPSPRRVVKFQAEEFDRLHEKHERSGQPKDKLAVLVDDLLNELGVAVP